MSSAELVVPGGTVTATMVSANPAVGLSMVAANPGVTFTVAHGFAGPDSTFAFYNQNLARLAQQASTDALTITSEHFGDSLTESASGGVGDPWVTQLSDYIAGVHDNEGIGGQTSIQINARVVAQSAGDLAHAHTLMMGTNNLSNVIQIMADYATSDAAVTGDCLVVVPIAAGTIAGVSGPIHRIGEELVATYGSRALDIRHSMRKAAAQTGAQINTRRGGNPETLMNDSTHIANATGGPVWAAEIAAAMRAQAGGAPFVHDRLVTWDSASSEDDVLFSDFILGTHDARSIVAGNGNSLFKINASGQFLRGAGTTYVEGGVQEVHVEASASGKGPGHTGRLMTARKAETDQPVYGVSVSGQGSILRAVVTSGETDTLFADSQKFSIAMLVRFPDGQNAGDLFLDGQSVVSISTASAIRFIPRGAGGASLGASITSPAVTDPTQWHAVFLSVDTATDTLQAVSVSLEDGVQSATKTGTLSTSNLALAAINGLFTNNSNDLLPWSGDVKFIWAADGSFIDWTSSTERDRFINSSTLLAATIAANGVVNSVTPGIYLRGRVGDYLAGTNFASGGRRFYCPFPINESSAVFNDAAGFTAHVAASDTTPPVITSSATASVNENATLAKSLTANETVTWAITGGADQAQFEISGSTLRWVSNGTQDYESPADADTNNTYVVEVTATDTALNASTPQTITVTVNDVAEASAAKTALLASAGTLALYAWEDPSSMTAGDGGAVVQGDSDTIATVPNAKNPGTLDLTQAMSFLRPVYNNGAIHDGSNDFMATAFASGAGPSNAVPVYIVKTTDTAFCLGGTNSTSYFAGLVQSGNGSNPYGGVGTPTYEADGAAVSPSTRGDLYTAWATGSAVIATIIGADFSNAAITDIRNAFGGSSTISGNCMLVAILDGGAGSFATDLANAETYAGEIITALGL